MRSHELPVKIGNMVQYKVKIEFSRSKTYYIKPN